MGVVGSDSGGAATTNSSSSAFCSRAFPRLTLLGGRGGRGTGRGVSCDASAKKGGGTGFRLGLEREVDDVEALEVGRSGGGRGVPGGGRGLPLPIGFSGVPARSEPAIEFCFLACSLLFRTFQPHCLAAAVATPMLVVGFLSDGARDLVTVSSIEERLDSSLVREDFELGLISAMPGMNAVESWSTYDEVSVALPSFDELDEVLPLLP
jgi:hypothetical protein